MIQRQCNYKKEIEINDFIAFNPTTFFSEQASKH